MNRKVCKRIIGLLIIAFAFAIFTPYDAFAKTCDEAIEYFETNGYTRYGVSINYDFLTNTYTIKMNPSAKESEFLSGAGITNPTFKINKIGVSDGNGKTETISGDRLKQLLSNKDTVSSKTPITFSRSSSVFTVNPAIVDVYLEPVGFTDPDLKTSCNETPPPTFTTTVSISVDRGKNGEVIRPNVEFEAISGDFTKIDCDNYTKYSTSSFEYNYCKDWKAAEAAGVEIKQFSNEKREYSDLPEGKNPLELRCNYAINKKEDAFEKSIYLADGKTPNPKYYKNISYFRGQGVRTESVGQYVYHVESTGKTETVAATCDIACNEVVTVEYGAPIAAKGGACFEYKVRVTSRVSCELKTPPVEPPKPIICTPTPICSLPSSSSTVTHNQGGPNEDFDKCIKKCDGGKYTEKCSTKCYKQVYGKSVSVSSMRKTTGTEISYGTKVLNSREYWNLKYEWPTNAKADQCLYVLDDDKDIVWVTDNGNTRMNSDKTSVISCDSSWHLKNDWGFWSSVYDIYRSTGIPSTSSCQETCTWYPNDSEDCTSGKYYVYLNDSETYEKYHKDSKDSKGNSYKTQYDKDMDANKEKYKELKSKCEAAVTCNTTTAEFTISVDYVDKATGTTKSINYPYENKDTIKYVNKDTTTCTDDDKFTTILSSAGCYDCDKATSQRMYQTEWTFPGVWHYLKGNSIEYYGSKINQANYELWPYKFCLPWGVADVNQKWYNYYQAKINGDNPDISYNSPDGYYNNIVCPNGQKLDSCTYATSYKNSTFTAQDAKTKAEGGSTDYNIKAQTRKFGFYAWDINISCFYAINSAEKDKSCKCVKDTNPDTDDGDPTKEYRIRPVDLNNLFPDTDGTTLSSADKRGRTPGFNWGTYATQDTKDPEYQSLPVQYATWIQSKGYNVYSDENLDYEVKLTKENINEIRKSNVVYTDWKGIINSPGTVEEKSASTYRSNLIRDKLSGSVYPDYKTLQCNNIGEHTPSANYSASCEDFSGEVK